MNLDVGYAFGIGFDISQITGVSDFIHGRAVGLPMRIEVSAGGSAAVGVVAKLVDVEAVLSFGEPAQLSLDGDRGADVRLREVNHAFHHLTVQNANSLQRHF